MLAVGSGMFRYVWFRYGLLGPNGAGKTTLMRNIANGAIDGLPTELRTVFVEHDIVGSDVSGTGGGKGV